MPDETQTEPVEYLSGEDLKEGPDSPSARALLADESPDLDQLDSEVYSRNSLTSAYGAKIINTRNQGFC